MHFFFLQRPYRYLCACVHVLLKLTLFKAKAGKYCLFLFRVGCDCNYCFLVFSEKLPCLWYLILKIYHLEMVCFLSFCILDSVWYENAYTYTCIQTPTHSPNPRPKVLPICHVPRIYKNSHTLYSIILLKSRFLGPICSREEFNLKLVFWKHCFSDIEGLLQFSFTQT